MKNPLLRGALIALKVTLATFITGNIVASLMGALPVTFTPIAMSVIDTKIVEDLNDALARRKGDPAASENLALMHFLHDDLPAARAAISGVRAPFEPTLAAVDAALRVKEAGAMLDFLFGQRKLARLNQALADLDRLASDNPDDTGIQVLALATFASLPNIDDMLRKAQRLAANLTPRLEQQSLPIELRASGWLAIAVTEAATAAETQEHSAALKRRDVMLARLDSLTGLPTWLITKREALTDPKK